MPQNGLWQRGTCCKTFFSAVTVKLMLRTSVQNFMVKMSGSQEKEEHTSSEHKIATNSAQQRKKLCEKRMMKQLSE